MQSAGSRSGARATQRLSAPRSYPRPRRRWTLASQLEGPLLSDLRALQESAQEENAKLAAPHHTPRARRGRCIPLRWPVARPTRVRAHPLARPSTSTSIRTPTAPAPQPISSGRPCCNSNNARHARPAETDVRLSYHRPQSPRCPSRASNDAPPQLNRAATRTKIPPSCRRLSPGFLRRPSDRPALRLRHTPDRAVVGEP